MGRGVEEPDKVESGRARMNGTFKTPTRDFQSEAQEESETSWAPSSSL